MWIVFAVFFMLFLMSSDNNQGNVSAEVFILSVVQIGVKGFIASLLMRWIQRSLERSIIKVKPFFPS